MKHLGIKTGKPRIAVFDFTCCEGCELQLVNKEDTLVDFLSLVEVLITTTLAVGGRIEAARAIDRHGRWTFPSAFSIGTAAILLR